MKTKYLDSRIKQYEDWLKNDVIKYTEKLELIELKAIKKQLILSGVVKSLKDEEVIKFDDWIKKGFTKINDTTFTSRDESCVWCKSELKEIYESLYF